MNNKLDREKILERACGRNSWFPLPMLHEIARQTGFNKIGKKDPEWYSKVALCREMGHTSQEFQHFPFLELLLPANKHRYTDALQAENKETKGLIPDISQNDAGHHFTELFGTETWFAQPPIGSPELLKQLPAEIREQLSLQKPVAEHYYLLSGQNGSIVSMVTDRNPVLFSPPFFMASRFLKTSNVYALHSKPLVTARTQWIKSYQPIIRMRTENKCRLVYPEEKKGQECDPRTIKTRLRNIVYVPNEKSCNAPCLDVSSKECIVKKLPSDPEEEYKTLDKLRDTQISPRVHALYQCPPDDEYYMLMDKINGSSVADYYYSNQKNDEIIDTLARNIIRKLKKMHSLGIHHGDLSVHPGNILVDSNGEPWIIDFGLGGELSKDLQQNLKEQLRDVNLQPQSLAYEPPVIAYREEIQKKLDALRPQKKKSRKRKDTST